MKHLHFVWSLRRHVRFPKGEARFNLLAAMVCLVTLAILQLCFHNRPADPGLDAKSRGPRTSGISVANTSAGMTATSFSSNELRKAVTAGVQTSKLALELHIAMLELGRRRIEAIPDYEATFTKQERLEGGSLLGIETIALKLRHSPLSIYMRWTEGEQEGRELLFIEGQNDNKMIVKMGGGKKLLPSVKVDPEGALAMSEARHPVTSAGLLQLCDKILAYRKRDLVSTSGVRWQLIPEQKFDGRSCHCFVVEYDTAEVETQYRKSITYLDQESGFPVCVKTFGWPTKGQTGDSESVDQQTLLEYYSYTGLKLDRRLSDNDFDKANADYKFRR